MSLDAKWKEYEAEISDDLSRRGVRMSSFWKARIRDAFYEGAIALAGEMKPYQQIAVAIKRREDSKRRQRG